MRYDVDQLLTNPFLATLAYFSVAILALILFLSLFEFVTKYDNWKEISQGNLAVAMATGGKIFGICNIFRFAVAAYDSIYRALIWAGFGFILLLAAYFIFEFLTPTIHVDAEIEKDNRAIGFISMMISIGLSFVIGSSVA